MLVEIAGAGIIGLSIAWRLAQVGFQVRVWDRGTVARQASWAGAGMLAPGGEFRPGTRWAELAVESLNAYPAFVAELTAATGVQIDYRASGALELAFSEEEIPALERARPLGVESESLVPLQAALIAPVRAEAVRAARWFPGEAVVDPRHICSALFAACRALGVEIRENEPMAEPVGPCVIAAGAWGCGEIAGLETAPRAFSVKGHLLGYQCPRGSLQPIVRRGHHYALQRQTGFTIFGSDEQPHEWSTVPDPYRVQVLSEAAAALLPGLLNRSPDEVWAGLRPGSETGEPVVEKVRDRDVWLAYGHFRNGILLAPVTARLVADSISSNLEKG